jgi:hypothetical protein
MNWTGSSEDVKKQWRTCAKDVLDACHKLSLTLVDLAGDAAVHAGLHARLGDQFVYNCMVGGTHWDAPRGQPAGAASASGRRP